MGTIMRWWATACLFGSVIAHAQLNLPVGFTQGDVVSWTGSPRSGELTIRNVEKAVYSCRFDAYTYFEREHQMIQVNVLAAGDPVEVLADRRPGSATCYARTVQVVEPPAKPLRRWRAVASPTEDFAPRGDLAFGGLVLHRDADAIVIKTRTGELRVNLRPDTRFLSDGLRLDAAALMVNLHVFVRAGHDIYGQLEAFQVIWGEIIAPR